MFDQSGQINPVILCTVDALQNMGKVWNINGFEKGESI